MTTIIIAVLGVLVLITLALIFGGKMIKFGQKTETVESAAGDVTSVECTLKCSQFNNLCVSPSDTNSGKFKVITDAGKCKELHTSLNTCKDNKYITNLPQSSGDFNKNEAFCK